MRASRPRRPPSTRDVRKRLKQLHRPSSDPHDGKLERALDVVTLTDPAGRIAITIKDGKQAINPYRPSPSAPVNDPTPPRSIDLEQLKEQAAETLASEIPAVLRTPGASRAWKQDGSELSTGMSSMADGLRSLLKAALKEAGARADTPQYIRLGRQWIKDRRGRKRKVVPNDLTLSQRGLWLIQEAYRTVSQLIGDRANYMENESEPVFTARALDKAAENARARMLRESETAATLLTTKTLSPRQMAILQLKEAFLTNAEIAQHLGISESTVRAHLRRARKSK